MTIEDWNNLSHYKKEAVAKTIISLYNLPLYLIGELSNCTMIKSELNPHQILVLNNTKLLNNDDVEVMVIKII